MFCVVLNLLLFVINIITIWSHIDTDADADADVHALLEQKKHINLLTSICVPDVDTDTKRAIQYRLN